MSIQRNIVAISGIHKISRQAVVRVVTLACCGRSPYLVGVIDAGPVWLRMGAFVLADFWLGSRDNDEKRGMPENEGEAVPLRYK